MYRGREKERERERVVHTYIESYTQLSVVESYIQLSVVVYIIIVKYMYIVIYDMCMPAMVITFLNKEFFYIYIYIYQSVFFLILKRSRRGRQYEK